MTNQAMKYLFSKNYFKAAFFFGIAFLLFAIPNLDFGQSDINPYYNLAGWAIPCGIVISCMGIKKLLEGGLEENDKREAKKMDNFSKRIMRFKDTEKDIDPNKYFDTETEQWHKKN